MPSAEHRTHSPVPPHKLIKSHEKEKKREDYTVQSKFSEKPDSMLGCPNKAHDIGTERILPNI